MAKSKKDLGAALAKAKDSKNFETPTEEKPVLEVRNNQPTPEQAKGQGGTVASTREGKKLVSVYIDEEMHTKLKILSIHQKTTIQELGTKALQKVLEEAGQ